MSRYSGYPRWALLVKAGIWAVFMPVIVYLWLCNAMSMHYRSKFNYYEDAGMDISSGWMQGRDFDNYHVCVSHRYLDAGSEVAGRPPFDLWWMIRNWNKDFLAEQPPCQQPPIIPLDTGDSRTTGANAQKEKP